MPFRVKFVLYAGLLIVATCFANPAIAGINVSIDWDATLANGIQSNIDANPGDTVTATIVFSLTGSSSISTYEISTRFASSSLLFVSRTGTGPADLQPTPPPPGGAAGFNRPDLNVQNTSLLVPPLPPDPTLGVYGFNQQIAGTVPNFGDPGPTALTGPFAVAAITFTVLPGASGTVILPGLFNEPEALDVFFDNNNTIVPSSELSFSGGTITAVPEPSSMALLSLTMCAIGLAYFRQHRSHHA